MSLTLAEVTERAADQRRRWFVNETDGKLVDALPGFNTTSYDRSGENHYGPNPWIEVTAAYAVQLASITPAERVTVIRARTRNPDEIPAPLDPA